MNIRVATLGRFNKDIISLIEIDAKQMLKKVDKYHNLMDKINIMMYNYHNKRTERKLRKEAVTILNDIISIANGIISDADEIKGISEEFKENFS